MRHQTDLGAQTFLGNAVHVLAVDRNRAALRFVKTQEQVDDGGFTCAAAADQADFFAGFDVQIKAVKEWFACFVGEIDVIKLDFSSGDFQRQGLRFVEDGVGFGQGGHAVIDGTDVFKQSGRLPHDVLRQTVHTQCHGRGGGYRAYADLAVIPKPNTQGGRTDGQRAVDDKTAGMQQRCQTHLGMDGYHKLFHRLLGISGLACAVGEEFDSSDIGIGVGNAAGHQRARISLACSGFAEFGNQEAHNHRESNHPADKRHDKPGIE